MTVNSKETLFLTLAFIVPGFLWHCVNSMLIPDKKRTTEILFLRFLTFSCFNIAIWSWLLYIFAATQYTSNHPLQAACLWAIIIFVSPVLLGGVTGYLDQKGYFKRMLSKLGIKSIHSTPTAWDYKFYNTHSSVWVQIKLKDGKTIRGLYGSRSFASSESDERDIYIQQAVKVSDQKWEKIEKSDGILVKGDQIEYIEFIKD